MDAALKELDKLHHLTSDSPSTSKTKTPAIQDSLNSLLQTLHAQKKRLEAGITSEAELATLAKTVESRKKEIDERQKEIYNSLARYGKALDKVCLTPGAKRFELMESVGSINDTEIYDTTSNL